MVAVLYTFPVNINLFQNALGRSEKQTPEIIYLQLNLLKILFDSVLDL